jgi:ATP-binding cassette subfamily B protein
MKILLQYLKPYKWMVGLVLLLAAVNIGFSMMDPIIFGKLIKLAAHQHHAPDNAKFNLHDFLFVRTTIPGDKKGSGPIELYGVIWLVGASITVAMISRIAKNFQDYFLQVVVQKFGAKVFTDGLRHSMKLPYAEFEDQRSGETLSILQKVRADTEKFMSNFVNILFSYLLPS